MTEPEPATNDDQNGSTELNGVHPIMYDDDPDDLLLCLDTEHWGEIEIPLTNELANDVACALTEKVDTEQLYGECVLAAHGDDVVRLSEETGNAPPEAGSE